MIANSCLEDEETTNEKKKSKEKEILSAIYNSKICLAQSLETMAPQLNPFCYKRNSLYSFMKKSNDIINIPNNSLKHSEGIKRPKKTVCFRTPFTDIIIIESLKMFNLQMTYDQYKDNIQIKDNQCECLKKCNLI